MSKVAAILAQVRPDLDVTGSQDFFEDGALDSFDLITLISELDQAYAISIDGLDIVPDNFATIAKIEALVARYGVTP